MISGIRNDLLDEQVLHLAEDLTALDLNELCKLVRKEVERVIYFRPKNKLKIVKALRLFVYAFLTMLNFFLPGKFSYDKVFH